MYIFQETANKSRNFTLRDINLLKIILCSGLYPQVAISDDCNSYKSTSEQAFHTKVNYLNMSLDTRNNAYHNKPFIQGYIFIILQSLET